MRGTPTGLVAGTAGGLVERGVLSPIDAHSALPPALLAIMAVSLLGPPVAGVVVILGVTGGARFARSVAGMNPILNRRRWRM